MTEPNKGGRKPIPDHLKRKRRIYFLNDAENASVEKHIETLRVDPQAVDHRPEDRRKGKRESK